MQDKFYICRRNDSKRLNYYAYFNGRNGKCQPKNEAPQFDRKTADTIVRHLAALDNGEWFVLVDEPKPEKKSKKKGKKNDANRAA